MQPLTMVEISEKMLLVGDAVFTYAGPLKSHWKAQEVNYAPE